MHLASLEIHSMLIGVGLLRSAMMLFNRPLGGQLPESNRDPGNVNNDDMHYEALWDHQRKYDKGKDTQKDHSVFIAGAKVTVQ